MSGSLSRCSATRLALLAICVATLSACSSSPRFTGGSSPVEPKSAPSASTPDQQATRFPPREVVVQEYPDGSGGDSVATPDARGDEIVQRAEAYLGAPYRSGGTTPNGVDCSGLTFAVYRAAGVELPRSSDDQARVGEPVSREELVPGDLVFFGSSGNVSHVGIYVGDGAFIHASTGAREVRFDRLDSKYFTKRFVTARRVQ